MTKLIILVLSVLFMSTSLASADIWRDCKNKWGSNQQMVDYCAKKQKEAYSAVKSSRGVDSDIKNNCRDRWQSNYEMVKYCMDNQSSAQRDLKSINTSSGIENECRNRWGTNYEMIKYCIEKKDPMTKYSNENSGSYIGPTNRSGLRSYTGSSEASGWTPPVAAALPMVKLSDQDRLNGLHIAQCPKCDMTIAYTDFMSGRQVNCDRCNQPRIIP